MLMNLPLARIRYRPRPRPSGAIRFTLDVALAAAQNGKRVHGAVLSLLLLCFDWDADIVGHETDG